MATRDERVIIIVAPLMFGLMKSISLRRTTAISSGIAAVVAVCSAGTPAVAATPHATISGDGNVITYAHYDGGAGRNDLRVSRTSAGPEPMTSYFVLRDVVSIELGKGSRGCTYPTASDHRVVRCVTSFDTATEPVLHVKLGGGNDRASIAGGALTTTIDGGSGDDRLYVAGNVNVLHGGSGNDTITATAGNAIGVYGDSGNDTITGSNRSDPIYGGPGNDTIRGGKGADTIFGNSGKDRLYGNSGKDVISGGPGRDWISGGPGADKVRP